MAIRQVINSVIKPAIRKVIDAIMNAISAYRFDGFDDHAVLAYRAINPDGDNTYEFWTPSEIVARRMIIAQSIAATFDREFNLYVFNGQLFIIRGGTITSLQGVMPNTRYGIVQTGNSVQLRLGGIDGQLVRTITATSGSVREPSAQTVIGARGTTTTPTDFFNGLLYNVKINGVTYPISDRNQSVQLPSPTNLGTELITQTVLENPFVKGTQWTYLGGGRWQYIGDGSFNELSFINSLSQPEAGFLEFEVESITGQMRCYTTTSGVGTLQSNTTFSTTGRFRHFYTSKAALGGNSQYSAFVRANTGVAASCIIKNISFKPLITVNSTELVSNGTFSTNLTGWSQIGVGGSVNVTSGEVVISGGTSAGIRQLVNPEVGTYYQISLSARRTAGSAGLAFSVGGQSTGSMGVVIPPTGGITTAIFLAGASSGNLDVTIAGDGTGTTWIIDNVSLRKIDSLCNPLTLVNSDNYWWSTVGAASRDVYVFDGVDDHATLPYRAINPDGDNSFEFWSPNASALAQTIISQNISETGTAREFHLYGGANISVIWGGTETTLLTTAQGYEPNKKYWLNFVGNNFTIAKDLPTNIIRSASFTRGTVREPTAVTRFGARGSGVGVGVFFGGIQRDVKINGVLYSMDNRNQTIQLPEPLGLGAELITPTVLENPLLASGGWTYLGNGRWGITNGTGILRFFSSLFHPNGYLEYEVESISGRLSCTVWTGASPVVTTIGSKRYFYVNDINANKVEFKPESGNLTCIIKNISFKPLTVTNPTELVTNGDFSQGTAGWAAQSGGSLSVVSGQATLTTTAGQNSRIEQTLTVQGGFYHEASFDIVALNTVTFARLSVFRGAAGGYAQLADVTRNSAGRISVIFFATGNDAVIQVRGDFSTAGSVIVDNVSIRKLDSLCNPMQLSNTTSDRWREIDK